MPLIGLLFGGVTSITGRLIHAVNKFTSGSAALQFWGGGGVEMAGK